MEGCIAKRNTGAKLNYSGKDGLTCGFVVKIRMSGGFATVGENSAVEERGNVKNTVYIIIIITGSVAVSKIAVRWSRIIVVH